MAKRRVRLREIGWASPIDVEPFETLPVPTGHQVLVEVEACGVCHRDLIDRAGRFPFLQLPITPGHEAVGRVVSVGDAVTDWEVGDRVASMHRDYCGECDACEAGETSLCGSGAAVLGLLTDGGYASYLCAPERCFFRVPDAFDPVQASVFHCTAGTAYRGLWRFGRVEAGMDVLVTGANGGVGAAAVQVAKRLGARVVGVVRRDADVPFVEALGAAEVIVDDGSRFHKRLTRAIDVALDCVGEPTFNAALRSLRVGGRVIAIGNVVQAQVGVNLGYVVTRGLQIIGSSGATRRDMEGLFALHEADPFEVSVHAELPLEEADRAQRMVAAGGLRGRIVLRPEPV